MGTLTGRRLNREGDLMEWGGLSDRRLNIEQDLIKRMLVQGRKAY